MEKSLGTEELATEEGNDGVCTGAGGEMGGLTKFVNISAIFAGTLARNPVYRYNGYV